jgi:hypothetical protein
MFNAEAGGGESISTTRSRYAFGCACLECRSLGYARDDGRAVTYGSAVLISLGWQPARLKPPFDKLRAVSPAERCPDVKL